MPFFREIHGEGGRIGLWLLNESVQELERLVTLSKEEREELNRFGSDRRKREFLAVRALMKEICQDGSELGHYTDGRPFLKNNADHFISISHSRNLVALLYADRPAGIDAEETNRKIAEVAPRFLSEAELEWTARTVNPRIAKIFCWSCKESVYKMLGDREADFREHFRMEPVMLGRKGTAILTVTAGGSVRSIKIFYHFLQGNVVTWCLD